MANENLEAVSAELEAAGVKFTVRNGGKHIHLEWQHEGAARMFVVPATPSDRRGWLNARTDVRKILREDGLIGSAEIIELPRTFLKERSVFVSSLDIARHFEKAHKDVLRAIDRVCDDIGDKHYTERNFAPSSYTDSTGRSLRSFDLSRDGFSLVVMSFTGSAAARWKVSYLDAINAMEAELLRAADSAPAELTAEVAQLKADLNALIELSLEAPPAPKAKKPRFVRPSILRRMRRRAA